MTPGGARIAPSLPSRLAAGSGVAVPPLAAATLLAVGWLSPGADPLRRTVSRLAEPGAPYAALVDLTLAALGLSLLAVGWGLRRHLATGATGSALALAVAGAALIGVALVHRDPTRPAFMVLHRSIALVLFAGLALAPLLAAGRLRIEPAWHGVAVLSAATAGLSSALLVAALALLAAGDLPAGAWERAYVGLNLLWVTLLALRLLRA